MVFPTDAITISGTYAGDQTITLLSADSANPKTILGVRMQQSGQASEAIIDCGTYRAVYNFAKDYPQDLIQAVCVEDIVLRKTGNDTAFISLTYVPYNIHATLGGVPAGQNFQLQNSFTFGEITIALLLMPLLAICLYQTVIAAFRKPVRYHK